jgi:hypothetical protein
MHGYSARLRVIAIGAEKEQPDKGWLPHGASAAALEPSVFKARLLFLRKPNSHW